jgi:hypothetical protein
MLREGGNAWQAKIEGLVKFSFTGYVFYAITANSFFILGSPSRFSFPGSAVGLS